MIAAARSWSLPSLGVLLLVSSFTVFLSSNMSDRMVIASVPPVVLSVAIVVIGLVSMHRFDDRSVFLTGVITSVGAGVGIVAFWWVGFLREGNLTFFNPPEAFINVIVLMAAFGTCVGYFYSARNRETRYLEKANSRFRDRNQRLEEFIGFVSHDFRNPLNVAKGHLELAAETNDDEHFERVRIALNRMERLIEGVGSFAEQSPENLPTKTVNVERIASRAAETTPLGNAKLTIDVDLEVEAVPERLEALFENIFKNAVLHAGPDATIFVGTLPSLDGFFVEDDGPGIEFEDRQLIFEAGFTTTAESDRSGMGLGLSIVRQIADTHGWDITVTESDTKGARFEFRVR